MTQEVHCFWQCDVRYRTVSEKLFIFLEQQFPVSAASSWFGTEKDSLMSGYMTGLHSLQENTKYLFYSHGLQEHSAHLLPQVQEGQVLSSFGYLCTELPYVCQLYLGHPSRKEMRAYAKTYHSPIPVLPPTVTVIRNRSQKSVQTYSLSFHTPSIHSSCIQGVGGYFPVSCL